MTAPDPRLLALSGLIGLAAEARRAEGLEGFGFVAVNRTQQVLTYRTAILWLPNELDAVKVAAVSGVPLPDNEAPMVRWMTKAATALRADPQPRQIAAADLPAALAAEWSQWAAPSSLFLPLPDPVGSGILGGLWLFRDAAFSDGEIMLATHLASAYGETLARHLITRPSLWSLLPRPNRRNLVILSTIILAVALFPVRLSVLAPAELRPRDPAVIAAPRDGVVAAFHASANDDVGPGQLLISLDDTEARAQADIAAKALMVAEAEWRKAAQASFGDRENAGDMAVLQARIAKARAEADHASGLLARSKVEAPRAGLFVAPDPADWIGRPVRTGERIAALADPAKVEMVVWLPVADIIATEAGSEVVMYLNISPLAPLQGSLRSVSYDAQLSDEGVLAYHLVADLAPGDDIPRIGLKGTAKVHGRRVPLIAWVMRRPLAALRQMVGL